MRRLVLLLSCVLIACGSGGGGPGAAKPTAPAAGGSAVATAPACPGPAPSVRDERAAASFVVQDGTSQPSSMVSISEDGRWLAMDDGIGGVRVIDATTGLLLRRLPAFGAGHGIAIAGRGPMLFVADHDANQSKPTGIIALDPSTGKSRRIADYAPFALSRDEKTLAVGHKGIELHDALGAGPTRTIAVAGLKGDATALALDDKATRVAVAFEDQLVLVDVAGGKELARTTLPRSHPSLASLYDVHFAGDEVVAPIAGVGARIEIYPAPGKGAWKPRLTLDGNFGQVVIGGGRLFRIVHSQPKLEVFDLRTGKVAAEVDLGDPFRIAVTGDGETLITHDAHPIRGVSFEVRDGRTLRRIRTISAASSAVQGIAADPKGGELAVASFRVSQWGLADGALRAVSDAEQIAGANAMAYSPDGQVLFVIESSGRPVARAAGTGRVLRRWDGGRSAKLAAFAPGSREVYAASEDGELVAWDLAGIERAPSPDEGRRRRDPAPPKRTIGRVAFRIEHGAVSPDGAAIALTEGLGGRVTLVDARTGAVRWETKVPKVTIGVLGLAFTADGKRVLLSHHRSDPPQMTMDPELHVLDAATGASVAVLKPGTAGILAARAGVVLVGGQAPVLLDATTWKEKARVVTREALITAAAPHPTLDAFLVGGLTGSATLVAADGSARAVMVLTPDGENIAATPEGFFRASVDGARRVSFTFGSPLEGHSFEQFAALFDRPDMVARALALQPVAAPPIQRPPRVEIDAPSTLTVGGSRASVKATATSTVRVDRVRAFVNGRPAAEAAVCAPSGEASLAIDVPRGRSRVTVVAYDASGLASAPRAFDVVSNAAVAAPDVWVVAIGVSRYPALGAEYQLEVADDDARAIAEAVGKLAGPGRTYQKAHVTTLVDAEVTPAAVDRALAGLAAMRPDDLAVVFLAGHGMKVAGGKMVFLTSLAAASAASVAREGVGWTRIEEALSHARGRVLLLLDACHSGHVSTDRVAANDALASELQAQGRAGALVFAAARGAQLSYEIGSSSAGSRGLELAWSGAPPPRAASSLATGHGLFTAAVLEALGGGALDRDKSGAVEASELIDHVTERVREASAGKQTPWVARRELFGDFPIARRGE